MKIVATKLMSTPQSYIVKVRPTWVGLVTEGLLQWRLCQSVVGARVVGLAKAAKNLFGEKCVF